MLDRALRPVRVLALSLATASALQACSGSGSHIVPRQPGPSGNPTSAPGPGMALQAGRIVLPAGVTLQPGSLKVSNSVGSVTPSADGSFSLLAYSGGPQFALVTDAAGNPVLAGFLGPNSTTLDSVSTSKLLLYFAAGFYSAPSPLRAQLVDAVATTAGFASVQTAVESALAANPDAFATAAGSARVSSAIVAFVAALYAPNVASSIARQVRSFGRRGPSGVLVNPGSASGITVVNDFPDGIHFMNTFRRAAQAFVDEDSFVDANGNRVAKPVVDVVPPQTISAVSGLSNVTGTALTAVQGLFSGATQYTPVSTSSIPLALESGSLSTRYNVTVVGAGPSPPGVSLTSEQTSAQHSVAVLQLVQDFIVPIVASIVIPINSSQIDDFFAFGGGNNVVTDLITTLTTAAPQIADLMNSGQVGSALTLAVNTIATSNTLQAKLLQLVLNFVQNSQGTAAAQAAFAKGNSLLTVLNVLSGALVAADVGVVAANIGASSRGDRFVVDVTPDTVVLSPPSSFVGLSEQETLTATVPSAGGSGSTFQYDWSNTATVGHLTDGLSGHTDTFSSSHAAVTYTANGSGSGSDTVTVKVSTKQGSTLTLVGQATATVQVGAVATQSESGSFCGIEEELSMNASIPNVISGGFFGLFNCPTISQGTLSISLFGRNPGSFKVPGTAYGAFQYTLTGVPPYTPELTVFVGQPIGSSAIQSGGTFTCSVFNGGTFVGSAQGTGALSGTSILSSCDALNPFATNGPPFAAVLGPASVNPGTVQTLVFSH